MAIVDIDSMKKVLLILDRLSHKTPGRHQKDKQWKAAGVPMTLAQAVDDILSRTSGNWLDWWCMTGRCCGAPHCRPLLGLRHAGGWVATLQEEESVIRQILSRQGVATKTYSMRLESPIPEGTTEPMMLYQHQRCQAWQQGAVVQWRTHRNLCKLLALIHWSSCLGNGKEHLWSHCCITGMSWTWMSTL